MSKQIDTQFAAEGQPLTADVAANPSALEHLQQSYAEGFSAVVQQLIGGNYSATTLYRLWGVHITQVNDGIGNFTTTVTQGAVFYGGEIFLVDGSVFVYGYSTGTGLDTAITISFADTAGTLFDSGLTHQVLQIRKVVFSAKTAPTPPPLGLTPAGFIGQTLPVELPSTVILTNHGALNGSTLTFKQNETRVYAGAAPNGFSFTLDFTNAMPGCELVIYTPLSSVTSYTINYGGANIVLVNAGTPVMNTFIQLNLRFKYLGSLAGVPYVSVEDYCY